MPGVLQTARAAIAVFEREPYWAPELQRQFADGSVLVRSCSRLADVDAVGREWRQSLCVLEFETSPAAILTWLSSPAFLARPRLLVFARSTCAELEWTLREAGALSFRTELVTGRELANHCRRVLHRGYERLIC